MNLKLTLVGLLAFSSLATAQPEAKIDKPVTENKCIEPFESVQECDDCAAQKEQMCENARPRDDIKYKACLDRVNTFLDHCYGWVGGENANSDNQQMEPTQTWTIGEELERVVLMPSGSWLSAYVMPLDGHAYSLSVLVEEQPDGSHIAILSWPDNVVLRDSFGGIKLLWIDSKGRSVEALYDSVIWAAGSNTPTDWLYAYLDGNITIDVLMNKLAGK